MFRSDLLGPAARRRVLDVPATGPVSGTKDTVLFRGVFEVCYPDDLRVRKPAPGDGGRDRNRYRRFPVPPASGHALIARPS